MAERFDIPDLIKRLRDAKGLTQEQLAKEVGVTFCTVNSWQNGRHQPHAVFVNILAGLAKKAGIQPRPAKKKK
jgi:transcriptional regulator with XRE-family HTH domain